MNNKSPWTGRRKQFIASGKGTHQIERVGQKQQAIIDQYL